MNPNQNSTKTRIESLQSFARPIPQTRTSRGGLDEINPEDIVYGEYSDDGGKQYGPYIDLVYLDGEILRPFSGPVTNIVKGYGLTKLPDPIGKKWKKTNKKPPTKE